MFDNKPEGPYTQRIQKVFQRIQNIMVPSSLIKATNQDERSDKLKQIVNIIRQHQKMANEHDQEKLSLFETIFQRISSIQKRSIDESSKRQKSIATLQQNFLKAEKKCKNMISSNTKERQQLQKRFKEKIDNIFNKQKDILDQVMGYTNLNQLANYEQKLPALGEQLAYESELRSEIESKIYEQFLEQISELKKLFQNEKQERIHDHQQTLILLKSTYTKLVDKLKQEQNIREKNQALVLKVVEQLVNQITASYN